VLGSIALDPASCEIANRIVQAERFYSIADDGLLMDWKATTLFCNPPYGESILWTEKFTKEYQKGNFNAGILLVNMTPGYQWFEKLWRIFPVCSLRQKVSFVPGIEPTIKGRNLHLFTPVQEEIEIEPSGEAKKASGLFYAGNDLERFIEVMQPHGKIILP
jgi:hypothetical protein